MGLINFSNITDGTGVDANDINNPMNTIYNEFNGGIDSNNVSSIDGSKLTGGSVTSAKITAMNRQNLTTDTTVTAPLIQHGWSFITPGADAFGSKTITFPVAYSAVPVVILSNIGFKTGSDPTVITDFSAPKGKNIMNQTPVPSASSFVAYCALGDGTTYGSTERILFSWIAIGPS